MATEDTNGGRAAVVVGRRERPYANGSYQNYRWDNAVRALKRDGWTRLFKLTDKIRHRLRETDFAHSEGTLYVRFYDDDEGIRQKVYFLLNEDTMNALPGNLGNKQVKQ